MKRLFILLIAGLAPLFSIAQQETQSFGKVSPEDLTLKECSFEKDAHAMVLFDKADVYFDSNFDIAMERHKRIKIFDDKAKDAADIRLEFQSYNRYEDLYDLSAQTINVKDGKTVITKLDKKQIFSQAADKYTTALTFTFPDVQAGSIIEFKYKWKTPAFGNFPDWFFQSRIPTRYSELSTSIPDILYYKTQTRVTIPFFKNKSSSESKTLGTGNDATSFTVNIKVLGLQNIPSLSDEPYMTSTKDNLQSMMFQLTRIQPIGGFTQTGTDTWAKVGGRLADDEDFGLQLRKKLDGEDALITRAKALKTDEEKIAYLFNEVKNTMKWNGFNNWYTNDGTPKAWQKKTGNSTEINLILYRLLKQSDVPKVFPMIVSTRDHGKVNVAFPWLYQFNKAVVYIPVDSTKRYILDASDKYNLYNVAPSDLLNSYGVSIDKETKTYNVISINNEVAAKKSIYITAEVKPDGKMQGTANLIDFSYHKIHATELYKKDGDEKYREHLTNRDNSLKIKNLLLDNIQVDSLPLTEKIDFELELTGSDGDYIYFAPNLFSGLKNNPFLSENRSTTIDFGYNNKYTISGIFKLPAGYKVDALPKNINMVMPDKSIAFQRVIGENEGSLNVRYVIDFKKSLYTTDQYLDLRQFYKQMFDQLNEQVVLKKL